MSHSILIADDNLLVRKALRVLFEGEADFGVCGEAENGMQAVEKAQKLHPDLVLLDFSMPVMNGLAAARLLKRVVPDVPVVMYSAFQDPFIEKEAGAAGVRAWVSKSESPTVLLGKARSALDPRELPGLPDLSASDRF